MCYVSLGYWYLCFWCGKPDFRPLNTLYDAKEEGRKLGRKICPCKGEECDQGFTHRVDCMERVTEEVRRGQEEPILLPGICWYGVHDECDPADQLWEFYSTITYPISTSRRGREPQQTLDQNSFRDKVHKALRLPNIGQLTHDLAPGVYKSNWRYASISLPDDYAEPQLPMPIDRLYGQPEDQDPETLRLQRAVLDPDQWEKPFKAVSTLLSILHEQVLRRFRGRSERMDLLYDVESRVAAALNTAVDPADTPQANLLAMFGVPNLPQIEAYNEGEAAPQGLLRQYTHEGVDIGPSGSQSQGSTSRQPPALPHRLRPDEDIPDLQFVDDYDGNRGYLVRRGRRARGDLPPRRR
ncbi:uncharacterized protein AB675_7690 [Cyphellophora attinorum]|uniref:Uncharacterized protein n=1 Tax=Cyphellophora attinorum TaxID=1664694 RepID=A0A0N1P0M5_9EURO|nr:uncharacterized protein AB675_7690 [Phialophora attinorum]KPI40254.1 hypothetical protein AB675_7690 [Phialophora attinorum]